MFCPHCFLIFCRLHLLEMLEFNCLKWIFVYAVNINLLGEIIYSIY